MSPPALHTIFAGKFLGAVTGERLTNLTFAGSRASQFRGLSMIRCEPTVVSSADPEHRVRVDCPKYLEAAILKLLFNMPSR